MCGFDANIKGTTMIHYNCLWLRRGYFFDSFSELPKHSFLRIFVKIGV